MEMYRQFDKLAQKISRSTRGPKSKAEDSDSTNKAEYTSLDRKNFAYTLNNIDLDKLNTKLAYMKAPLLSMMRKVKNYKSQK